MLRRMLWLACLIAVPAGAGENGWTPVPDSILDEARGGFERQNVLASLSIERMISLNGAVVAESQLALADLARAAPQDMARAAALETLLVQNSLNDQMIRSQTTINTTVNSLAVLKNLNFGDSVRQALTHAIAPR
ncbi:hypothetical protein [Massilia endophytica]|uniref:hypothetical protein n=1 Tax=Massilia endophytica TaxID=2899220 RepID=UPI001E3D0502|nr:hypothetical protein [Massilia endophytica]UGQ48267.1 hypothetical protein LSQ66_07330 [Massilia endophytica]